MTPYDRDHAALMSMSLDDVKRQMAANVYASLAHLDVLADAGRLPANIRDRAVRVVTLVIDARWQEEPRPLETQKQQELRDLSSRAFIRRSRSWPVPDYLRANDTFVWEKSALLTWTSAETSHQSSEVLSTGTPERKGALWLLEALTDKHRLLGHGNHVMQSVSTFIEMLIAMEWHKP
jgi:hypothetical protein